MENNNSGACPVCGAQTKQDTIMVFCEQCGFSITQRHNNPPVLGVTVGIEMLIKK